jgi:hypothetical protein
MTPRRAEWMEHSRQALVLALDDLRARVEAKAAGSPPPAEVSAAPEVSALARLSRRFRLSPFERDVLLLAAGVEVDSNFADLVARWRGDTGRSRPTFALALSVLDLPHWDALSPYGVLRRGRLIRLADGAGLVDAPITIEEAVLHALNGLGGIDERLRPFVRTPDGGPVVPSQERAASQIVDAWSRAEPARRHKVLLTGSSAEVAVEVFGAACRRLELSPFVLDLSAVPTDRTELEDLVDLWERDAVLHDIALLVNAGEAEPPERRSLAGWLLDRLSGFVVAAGAPFASSTSPAVAVTIGETTAAEQTVVWRAALGPLADQLDGHLERLTEQFRLPARAIAAVAAELRASPAADPAAALADRAWDICRRQARGGLEDLAERLEPRATWDRLVLPGAQMDLLRSMATQVRHRFHVYERWGFRARSSRGFGVSALFHGPSGVGKTFAAEVLAQDLALDLYRVDLSATISKYIGETEKNLRRIFDAAEESGAILLFDEADALFGKRSEVSNSHDRYANLEVSYLLQRMEGYRGLAILTTNLKSALDTAFLRRLRFVVPFPFPSAAERERIWRHAFPGEVPLDPAVDWTKLARLAVAGGNIANIALDAAFRAAHDHSVVGMPQLLAAARAECMKIEKPITDNETRGWL